MTHRTVTVSTVSPHDFFGHVAGTPCQNDYSGTVRYFGTGLAMIYNDIGWALNQMRDLISTVNDSFAAENIGLDPDTPQGEAVEHLHDGYGWGNKTVDSLGSTVEAALRTAELAIRGAVSEIIHPHLDKLADDMNSHRGIADPVGRWPEEAWETAEHAAYLHNDTHRWDRDTRQWIPE